MTEPMRLKGKEAEQLSKKSQEGGFAETAKVIIQALLIAVVVRTFLFQPFNIPSGSLIPTLLIGDYLFVSKYSYGYSKYSFPFTWNLFSGRILGTPPKRGDIAVFKFPLDNSTDYIKRVIGLPGDTIKVTHARLYINGQLVPREPTTKITTADQFGNEVAVATYKETLPGGVTHLIIQRDGDDGSLLSNTDVFEVPQGEYFMMGDNRDNSTDSRVPPEQGGVGYVPFENFVGRAEIIFFSIKPSQNIERMSDTAPVWQFWHWDLWGWEIFKVWNWPADLWHLPDAVRWNRIFQPVR